MMKKLRLFKKTQKSENLEINHLINAHKNKELIVKNNILELEKDIKEIKDRDVKLKTLRN